MQIIKALLMLYLFSSTQSSMEIITPRPGDVLQGETLISVEFDQTDFIIAELEFRYTSDDTNTWFLLYRTTASIPNGALMVWNTSVITDGSYDLRLRIILHDQSVVVAIVPDLKIRNYTAIETITNPIIEEPTVTLSDFVSHVPLLSATQVSKNNASISPGKITASLGYGLLVAMIVIFSVSIYLRLRYK